MLVEAPAPDPVYAIPLALALSLDSFLALTLALYINLAPFRVLHIAAKSVNIFT